MTKTLILGTIFVASLAIALVSAPGIDAFIQSTLGLDDAKAKSNSAKLTMAKYSADGNLDTDADVWLGVGEFVEDPFGTPTAIVTTSHPGFFDSEDQSDALDAVWHNHVVALHTTATCPNTTFAVTDLTFESPGTTNVNNNKASIHNVDFGTYTGQFSGIPLNATALSGASVLFQLNATGSEVCVIPLDVIP